MFDSGFQLRLRRQKLAHNQNRSDWSEVSPGDVFLSSHGPWQRWVSGRRQRGGAYRLTATQVRADVVILMWGVCWAENASLFSFSHPIYVRFVLFNLRLVRALIANKQFSSLSVQNNVIKPARRKCAESCCNYLLDCAVIYVAYRCVRSAQWQMTCCLTASWFEVVTSGCNPEDQIYPVW